MNEAEIQRQKEIKEAEELLFTGPQALGFAKGLFLGRFVADWAMPYPRIPAAQQAELDKSLAEIRTFLDEHLDPVAIDRNADIPRHLIEGLAHTGVLGMTAPKEYGGRGFSQSGCCKILEEIGARRAWTSGFRNGDHGFSGHTGHAGIHDARAADGKARDSRDSDGPLRHARHGGAERKYPGADREGIEGRVDGPGFRSHHVRRVLHGRGEDLSGI